ncbi:hypothetical protein ACEQ8H_005043 [Pleosporales sp. CAS-2024a]
MDDAGPHDERTAELDTLQSIYPELLIHADDPYTASLDLLVAPSKPLPVAFEPGQDVERLPYLPALHIDMVLPASYPSDAPPDISLSTTPTWLPPDMSQKLIDLAKSLWDEYGGGQMLFSYVSTVQEQSETVFGLQELTLPLDLRQALLAYNQQMKRELFDKETFDCGVCLEPKKGSACYRMQRCSHVFCVACLQDYYNNCIQEGHVNHVKCMSTDCGKSGGSKQKKDKLLSPKELLQIPLARDAVERYMKIKRKKKMESDPTMVYCPRSWCQGPMRTAKYPKFMGDIADVDESDSEADEDTAEQKASQAARRPDKRPAGTHGMDRLAQCEDCTFSFCKICLASWHGDFVRCEARDKSELTEEDQASLNFILNNTSPCPTCGVPCQKSYGCNHMTCANCSTPTHFCYLCGAWLDPGQPYRHFNDPKNKHCFNRLMDGAEGDGGGVQFGGARGAAQVAEFWEQQAMRIQMEINAEDAA